MNGLGSLSFMNVCDMFRVLKLDGFVKVFIATEDTEKITALFNSVLSACSR